MSSETDEKAKYYPLSPTNEAEGCEKYLEALEWALDNKNRIKNIAISGAYGSGKSSIIETFIKRQEQKTKNKNKFLNISLATFRDSKKDQDDSNNQETEIELQRLIELSILQQLFYHEDDKNIPLSRFKKIKIQGKWQSRVLHTSILLFIVATLFLLFPNTIDKLLNIKTGEFYTWVKYVFSAIFVVCSAFFGYKLIKIVTNLSITKLSMQGNEIEIDGGISKSILNSHIDEILYFFEATNYNVVIIEDLDHFEQVDIFSKLREINLLINNSKKVKNKVVFIYAIRDDMFSDKERAKFFDFMIPIIPVINFSNSCEKLLKIAKENNYVFDKELISDLSLFIDDMRLLYNIMNEFNIYSNKFNKNLSQNKLLAMIVYKNICPKDFVELSENKGNLYSIISKRNTYIEQKRKEYDEPIEKLKENLKKAEKEHFTDIKELRILYISKVVEKLSDVFSGLCINNEQVSVEDFTTDDNFEIIKEGLINYLKSTLNRNNNYNIRTNPQTTTIDFSAIEKEVDPKRTYAEREDIIRNKIIPPLKEKIEKINAEKENVQKRKLKELLSENSISIEIGSDKKSELISVLLRNGYIDEDYLDYISIFHEGSITKEDYQFLINVKREQSTDFDYPLNRTTELISKIHTYTFEKETVFNYKLADALINQTNEKQEAFFKQLANEKDVTISFIESYLQHTEHKKLFIQLLCAKWTTIWNYIQTKSVFTDEKKEKYFTLIIQYAEIEDIQKIFPKNDSYIANYGNFFSIKTAENKKEKIVKDLSIQFQVIDANVSETILTFLYENNSYALTIEMIKAVIPKTTSITNDFSIKNYSFIKSSDLNLLNDYIEANINNYVKLTLLQLENNTKEDLKHVTTLLNNKKLNISLKEQLIQKQEIIIQDITTIEDVFLWNLLFKHLKIHQSWENILAIFEKNENILSEEVIEYLNKIENATILSKTEISQDENEDNTNKYGKLNKAIILCDSISIEVYKLLTKSSPWYYSSFETRKLTKERIEILIEKRVIEPSPEAYLYLKNNFNGTHIQLLEKQPDKFNNNLSYLKFDKSDLELIIQSKKLSNTQKYNCIKTVSNVAISSDKVSQFVIDEPIDYELEDSLKIALLHNENINADSRIRFFNKNRRLSSIEDLETFLNSLGEEYKIITDKNKKATLVKTDINTMLLKGLKQIKYISSFSIKKDKLIVNHFQNKEEI